MVFIIRETVLYANLTVYINNESSNGDSYDRCGKVCNSK